MTGRLPPHNIEAEQAVLGALLQWPDAIDRIHWLDAGHFYHAAHRNIYLGIADTIEAGEPLDALTLSDRLRRAGTLEAAGGLAYLTQLVIGTPSAANIHHHARRIREAALLRETAALAADIRSQALEPGADGAALAEDAIARLDALLEFRNTSEPLPYAKAIGQGVDYLDAPEQGIGTGYSSLDALFRLREGDLVVIAGRPSMGKSALAHCIVEHVAAAGVPAAIFSLEMSARQLGVRAVKWHERQLGRAEAIRYCAGLPIWIDDGAEASVGRVRLKCRRLKRQHGIKVVMLDYLQLMQGDGRADNRTQEIGSISRGLKRMAKELGLTVILVSQLNRGVESRTDRRPVMSDLRESGEVEQDADVVAMVYRDDYYHDDSPVKGFAEVLVRKHREGATGTAWLRFMPDFPRFLDYAGPAPRSAAPEPDRLRRMRLTDVKREASGDA